MRIRFLDHFDYRPTALHGRVTVAYEKGMVLAVKRECGEQAVKSGAGVEVRDRSRQAIETMTQDPADD